MTVHQTQSAVLHELPLKATRSGALFHAHAYPTKISPQSIALFIACHTKPGDTVYDGFGGSGTTAIAALLCSKPSRELIVEAGRQGLSPKWGPRHAVVYELSGLGSFIGQTLCSRVDAGEFAAAARRVLTEAERRYGWLYNADDNTGRASTASYFIWTDGLQCPNCRVHTTMWQACVRLAPARISSEFQCPKCRWTGDLGEVPRLFEANYDDILQENVSTRMRRLARVNGDRWSREPTEVDTELVARIQAEIVPKSFPCTPMMGKGGKAWGDLWRSGYHDGVTHLHHFYTRRNLIANAVIWELVNEQRSELHPALFLWASSYNASHSTLMTRVVAKKDHKDLVLTSAQPGVLYISALPVEKNVFLGLRRKIKTIADAFRTLSGTEGNVQVVQGTGAKTHLGDASVDYVFMDPPFGGNIPYSEVNFIAEAWLRRPTAPRDEAIISSAQQKSVSDYEALLTGVFREARRILKPKGKASVVFHSTQSVVWKALVNAYTKAGFSAEDSTILDKTQGSFKQVTTRDYVQGDPVILLTPYHRSPDQAVESPQEIVRMLLREGRSLNDPDELSPQRLYSRFVSFYVRRDKAPPMNADRFYEELTLLGAQW